jgi:hypothetical protein
MKRIAGRIMAVRYTVDVTDAIPVPVGELQQWRVRLA